METKIKVNYRGFEILYREETENWSCKINDNRWYEKQTLKECKKSIDNFLKREDDFQRIDVYILGRWKGETFEKVTVTSITEKEEAWIKDKEGERTKVERGKLIKITDANILLMDKYNEQVSIIMEAQKERAIITSKFEWF